MYFNFKLIQFQNFIFKEIEVLNFYTYLKLLKEGRVKNSYFLSQCYTFIAIVKYCDCIVMKFLILLHI